MVVNCTPQFARSFPRFIRRFLYIVIWYTLTESSRSAHLVGSHASFLIYARIRSFDTLAPSWRPSAVLARSRRMNGTMKSRFFAHAPAPASSQSRYFAARSSAPEPPSADAASAVLPELPAAAGGASADCLPACPKCGLQLRHRTGRYGPFIGCSGFPSCRHTGRYGAGEPPPAAGPSAAKPRSRRSCLCVRVEMESETSVRVWCSQGEPQQQWLRALLARHTHMPALGTGPRADWLAQVALLHRVAASAT